MKPSIRLVAAGLCCGLVLAAQAQTNYQRLRSFGVSESSGRLPNALLEGSDGQLYGATGGGGDHDDGTVFTVGKDGTGISILHHFTGLALGARVHS